MFQQMFKWMTPIVAMGVMAIFSGRMVKADDAPATQPSAAKGSIVVTILDSDSKPVSSVSVKLYATKKPKPDSDAKPKKAGKALLSGKTDDDGKYTFPEIANGDYVVTASKKSGGKGMGPASVSDATPEDNITISLSAAEDNGGATTAPSPQ